MTGSIDPTSKGLVNKDVVPDHTSAAASLASEMTHIAGEMDELQQIIKGKSQEIQEAKQDGNTKRVAKLQLQVEQFAQRLQALANTLEELSETLSELEQHQS